MSSKFGALSKLNAVRPENEEPRKLESQEKRKIDTEKDSHQENLKPIIPETEEPWVALGTEVQRATKLRLKAYAGAHGEKVKDLVDKALTSFLDRLEN